MDDRRIVALAFETPELANQAMEAARRMQREDLLHIHDAVVVRRQEDGRAEVTSLDPAPAPTTLFSSLIATISAAGALLGKLVDTGIPQRVVGELQELAKPGQTVLALLVSDLAAMAVIEELRQFRGTRVVYARLPGEALEVMEQALQS